MPILRAEADSQQPDVVLPDSTRVDQVDMSPVYRGEPVRFVELKITHFEPGGFEMVVRPRVIVEDTNPPSPGGRSKRQKPDHMSTEAWERFLGEIRAENAVRAAQRAKTQVRHLVRQIGATTLATFTTREAVNTRERLYEMLEAFVRAYTRALGKPLDYVAVAERHPSNPNHWHMHVAIRGWHSINVCRPLWWVVCGGRGMGNIQLSDGGARVRSLPKEQRSMKMAGYLSKYLAKSFDDKTLFGKKRYSASEFERCCVSVIKLDADICSNGAVDESIYTELVEKFGFDFFEAKRAGNVYVFPNRGGFWAQVAAGWEQPPPPF